MFCTAVVVLHHKRDSIELLYCRTGGSQLNCEAPFVRERSHPRGPAAAPLWLDQVDQSLSTRRHDAQHGVTRCGSRPMKHVVIVRANHLGKSSAYCSNSCVVHLLTK